MAVNISRDGSATDSLLCTFTTFWGCGEPLGCEAAHSTFRVFSGETELVTEMNSAHIKLIQVVKNDLFILGLFLFFAFLNTSATVRIPFKIILSQGKTFQCKNQLLRGWACKLASLLIKNTQHLLWEMPLILPCPIIQANSLSSRFWKSGIKILALLINLKIPDPNWAPSGVYWL